VNRLKNQNSSILILGTKATINSGQYEKLLRQNGYNNLVSLSPSLFVPIVEEGLFEGEVLQSAMEHYFKDIKQEPDAIILGCTHFPLISEAIRSYFPRSALIHSGDAIVEYLSAKCCSYSSTNATTLKLLASDNLESVKKTAKIWLHSLI
ncbi:MAG: aspartate/glutamate racemase family protein, partial [Campylobacteraceae bacterium]|nr:aspartate/glutamate racemase family protein [Campylobacteraceae bacterium]